MLVSGETARYELSQLKSALFAKTSILLVALKELKIFCQKSYLALYFKQEGSESSDETCVCTCQDKSLPYKDATTPLIL